MYRIGFGKRFAAVMIDRVILLLACTGLLLGCLGALVSFKLLEARDVYAVASRLRELHGSSNPASFFGLLPLSLLLPLAFVSVYGWALRALELFFGMTPGKALMGICIAAESGRSASFRQLAVRFAAKNIYDIASLAAAVTGSLLLFKFGLFAGSLIGLGCFLVLGSARMALHDRLSGTAVYLLDDLFDSEGGDTRSHGVDQEFERRQARRREGKDPNDLLKPRWEVKPED